MNYQETLAYLFERLPMFQRIGKSAFKKDLSNTLKLCEALGNPQNKFKSIHIAGTNGKGSTAHSLASILQESSYKTGLYTSPHLKSFTERIKINGVEVSEDYIVEFVHLHNELIEDIRPSFFEITVAMAFDYFAKEKVDIAVLEVGMGGRFDSTNVIDPILSVITSIDLDHMEFLGPDISSIAFEKAGIIKNERPVVISEWQEESAPIFIEKAKQCQSEIYFAEDDVEIESKGDGKYLVKSEIFYDIIDFELKGDYQIHNLPGIIKSAELLNFLGYEIKTKSICIGLEKVIRNTGIKGRWQILSKEPWIICDTGHNEEGMRYILNQINNYKFDKLIAVLGFVNDKNINKILDFWPKDTLFIFCQANIPRAMNTDEIIKIAEDKNLCFLIKKDVNKAIELAEQKASINDFIFVGGSTFVIAEIKDL
ncbi:bifunctional folylpolyglutamate synthase/dihydrofolate synthase [Hyphobacterium sp. CCMP332]|nr:bifunctional folylpolyglutamate synthase/dihydrofolate synthase [Hyphobacterium sp. CCMP332]